MKKINNLSKILLSITLISGIIWFGAYLARLLMFYQIFQEKDFVLKSYIVDSNLSGILITLFPIIVLTSVSYVIFILFLIVFVIISKVSLKKEGWLFISFLTILITAPFNLYLCYYDFNIIVMLMEHDFNATNVLSAIIKQFNDLNSFPLIQIFAYSSIIILSVFQPFKIKDEN